MVVEVFFQALKSLLIFFLGVWRRALCCFRRRRRMSCDSVPLTEIGVISDYPKQSCNSNDLENWNNWEDNSNPKPNSIQEHIEYYRKQAMAARSQSEESQQENEDFFQDMTPRITRQTKVFVATGDDHNSTNSTRLSLAPQPIVAPEGELGEWEETAGWEEQTQPDYDPQAVLREKRRQERERRIWEQQQRRQEKVIRPILGAKIS